jgi:hypothetical protein
MDVDGERARSGTEPIAPGAKPLQNAAAVVRNRLQKRRHKCSPTFRLHGQRQPSHRYASGGQDHSEAAAFWLCWFSARSIAFCPDGFATGDNLANMTRLAAILATAAIAQSVRHMVKGFDIPMAVTMGFVSIVAACWMTSGGGAAGGVRVVVLAVAAVGLVNGILVGTVRATLLVVTLAMVTFFRDKLGNGASIAGLSPDIVWLGRYNWGLLTSSVGIALIVPLGAVLGRRRPQHQNKLYHYQKTTFPPPSRQLVRASIAVQLPFHP